jgi:hypothetical protein
MLALPGFLATIMYHIFLEAFCQSLPCQKQVEKHSRCPCHGLELRPAHLIVYVLVDTRKNISLFFDVYILSIRIAQQVYLASVLQEPRVETSPSTNSKAYSTEQE